MGETPETNLCLPATLFDVESTFSDALGAVGDSETLSF
jgi:hypothetical protein